MPHTQRFAPGPRLDDILSLPSHFDFTAAREFLKKIKAIAEPAWPTSITLDFSRTDYIDTAGLGALLLFGERFGGKRTIRFSGARGRVRECLEIARIEERLSGWNAPAGSYDLRVCASCGKTAHGQCDGSLHAAARCRRTTAAAAVERLAA